MNTPQPILEQALELEGAGLAVIFQEGKRAIHKGWNRERRTAEQLRSEFRPGLNVAVVTGQPSTIGDKCLVVIDCDVRSTDPAHKTDAWRMLQTLIGDMKPTTRTGGGGAHWWFWLASSSLPNKDKLILETGPESNGKPAWTIEVLLNRHACTCPPSIHPETKKSYCWSNGGLSQVPDAPARLVEALQRAQKSNALPSYQLRAESSTGAAPASHMWNDPKPIEAPLSPVSQFDPEVLLPEVLRDWVMDEADRMPCAPDFIAVGAIVALGSVIGAHCAVKPKSRDDWLIVPNLWGGVVALPSAKKTPAISAALKPLDRLIALAFERHEKELSTFDGQRVAFEAQKEAIEGDIKKKAKERSDLAPLVRELQNHQNENPPAPTLRRYKTNDSTVEKLGEMLRQNTAGMLVLRDELVGLLASWDREGREGDRAFFLEGWNGNGSFDTDRIGRGSIFIPNLSISVFGGIQPDKLTGYLEQAATALANDGMLQRFQMLVYPDHREWEWRNRSPNQGARDKVFAVFEKLANFNPTDWGASPANDFAKFPHFRFTDEAQEIFIEWSADLHRNRLPSENHPIVAQHLAKFDKLFPALALILHLVDCADIGARGPISESAAIRAAAWCEYLETHARRCYGLLIDDGLRSAQALSEKVKDGLLGAIFTKREVRRNRWRYLTTDEAVQAALEWLEEESWLISHFVEPRERGGRPTRLYCVNQKIQQNPGRGAAKTDETLVLAATAAPYRDKSQIFEEDIRA
jgi:hypothetical protein